MPASESHMPVRLPFSQKAVRYDEASSDTSYFGVAAPGTATSAASWAIQKLVFGTGASVIITHADGNTEADNVWDNRASLTYS